MELTPQDRRHILEGFFVRAQDKQTRALVRFKKADARALRSRGAVQRYWDWRSVRLMERFHHFGRIKDNAKAYMENDPKSVRPLP